MVIYYLGAIIGPIILYALRKRLTAYLKDKGLTFSLSASEERLALLIYIIALICMELCWRMMFEAMIGYFDMHDYLYKISQTV
ncbi:DUF4282 domain-containing protein [Galenea microaerophila]